MDETWIAAQGALTTLITSGILYLLARWNERWREVPDALKRGLQVLIGSGVSYALLWFQSSASEPLLALATSVVAAIIGGTAYRMGRVQPGNLR